MATSQLAQLGECYRVKYTPRMRKYGYRVHTRWDAADNRAWPGEVGTIEEYRWIGIDGIEHAVLQLVFPRGRVRTLNIDGTIPDADNLVRVPRSVHAPKSA